MEFSARYMLLPLIGIIFFSTQCGQKEGFGLGGGYVERDYIYAGNFSSSSISTFLIEPDGRLTRSASTTSSGAGTANINSVVTVRAADFSSEYLYASHASTNNISSYSIEKFFDSAPSQVTLKETNASLGNSGMLTINPVLPFAYALNTSSTSNNLIVFRVESGSMDTAGTFSARTNPSSVVATPSGAHLYVTNQSTNDISAYVVNPTSGALTVVSGQPYLAATAPVHSAVAASGTFLYVLNQTSATISGYSIATSTGQLSNLSLTAPVGANPSRIAISPNDEFLYVSNTGSNSISVFRINSVTGSLTAVAGSPFSVAGQSSPFAIQVSLDNKFVFVSWLGSGDISSFSIDSSSGALTEISSSANSGTQPRSMVIVRLRDRG